MVIGVVGGRRKGARERTTGTHSAPEIDVSSRTSRSKQIVSTIRTRASRRGTRSIFLGTVCYVLLRHDDSGINGITISYSFAQFFKMGKLFLDSRFQTFLDHSSFNAISRTKKKNKNYFKSLLAANSSIESTKNIICY